MPEVEIGTEPLRCPTCRKLVPSEVDYLHLVGECKPVDYFVIPLPLLDWRSDPHVVGDPKCKACCSCTGTQPCAECGGLIHISHDDELDGEMWHAWRCDRPCACSYCPRESK